MMTDREFRKKLGAAKTGEDLKLLFFDVMKSLPNDGERLYYATKFAAMNEARGLRIEVPKNDGKG